MPRTNRRAALNPCGRASMRVRRVVCPSMAAQVPAQRDAKLRAKITTTMRALHGRQGRFRQDHFLRPGGQFRDLRGEGGCRRHHRFRRDAGRGGAFAGRLRQSGPVVAWHQARQAAAVAGLSARLRQGNLFLVLPRRLDAVFGRRRVLLVRGLAQAARAGALELSLDRRRRARVRHRSRGGVDARLPDRGEQGARQPEPVALVPR